MNRILIVHHAIDDAGALRGTTRCLLDLLTHLDGRRFDPVVWCNRPALRRVADTGAAVEQARDWATTGGRLSASWMREAAALIRRYRPTLVHVDEYTQAAALVPVARTFRLPLLVQLHRMTSARERRWALVHQADVVVGTSEACVAGLREDGFPRERTVVIYNGVDPGYLDAQRRTPLRAELGIGAGDVVITIAAYFAAFKAIEIGLRAFAAVRQRDPRCHLVLCGDGPERAWLEAQVNALGIAGFVHFIGHRDDVGAVLRDATDILLSTSRNESFGLTLAEAGVFGIPAVATDLPAHREVLAGGAAGLLFPVDDVAALADALGALAGDAEMRRRYGESLRRRVEERFLVHRYVRSFEGVYSRMLAEPASAHGWLRGTRWPRTYTRWMRERVGLLRAAPADRPHDGLGALHGRR